MFEIDRIPSAVKEVLKEKGIDTDAILLAVHADRTLAHTVGEFFLFATEQELIRIGGMFSAENGQESSVHKLFVGS